MPNPGKQAANLIQRATSLLSEGQTEKLVFRRFPGNKLRKAVENNASIKLDDVQTVILRVNPEQLGFSKRKVIQKVQTSAPGRFIVFDWGSELTVLSITGNTGNLLPDSITSGTNPLNNIIQNTAGLLDRDAADKAGQTLVRGNNMLGGGISAGLQNIMLRKMTYFELLEMSPKYKTFKDLEEMFDLADTDQDVLTLEIGSDAIYRGFFEDFSFTVVAENPWNWKYNVTFVLLADLSTPIRRFDDQFQENDFIHED
jgi:hypothetical protein